MVHISITRTYNIIEDMLIIIIADAYNMNLFSSQYPRSDNTSLASGIDADQGRMRGSYSLHPPLSVLMFPMPAHTARWCQQADVPARQGQQCALVEKMVRATLTESFQPRTL